MRKIINIALLSFLSLYSLSAISSAVDDSLKYYKEKQYHKAAVNLLGSQTNFDSLSPVNKLKTAIMLWTNAKLNREIGKKSLKTQKIFLESLLTEQSIDESMFIHLYLAEIYIHLSDFDKASEHLKRFKALPESKVSENYKSLAAVYESWIQLKQNNLNEFKSATKPLSGSNLILDLAVSFILENEGHSDQIGKNISDEISKQLIAGNSGFSSRVGNYALAILTAKGSLESARAIFNRIPIHEPSFVEQVSPIKVINFYESTLAFTLEKFYSAYATKLFSDISNDPKLGDIATFYLSEQLIFGNDKATANEFVKKVKGLMRLPKTLSPLKEIRSSTHGYLIGRHSRAYQVWEEAVNNDKNDPVLISDAILMCITVDGNCPTLVQKAQLSAENSRSKRFEDLSTNVGRYFLDKDLNEKALRLMEIALDRSDMNSLLANDPILLLNLAEAYRVNKKYSKSLQVYFSLGQNFPVMRQIQDAVQGEYLFQQRSAGQTNVF